jgi:hypothetical protein
MIGREIWKERKESQEENLKEEVAKMQVHMDFQEENRKEIKEDTTQQVKVSRRVFKKISRLKRARKFELEEV